MSDDLRDRLRRRNRPSVTPRDSSVGQFQPQEQELEGDATLDSSVHVQLSELKREPQTKRSTFRLEIETAKRLRQFCQDNEITRDAFLEALIGYFEEHPEIHDLVIEQASQQVKRREKVATLKRAKSMMQRLERQD
jgi:hypothetical protein